MRCHQGRHQRPGPRPTGRRVALWLVTLAVAWLLALLPLGAQTPPSPDEETREFNAAAKAFQDGLMDRAEKELAAFRQKYPASPRLPDVLLLQARASLALKQYDAAAGFLTNGLPKAGPLADQYQYWLAQTRLEQGQSAAAAAEFARLLAEHPGSSRRQAASYGEAQARFAAGEWPKVVELLRNPEGAFRKASQTNADPRITAWGDLLLGEALLRLQDYPAAAAAVSAVSTNLSEIAWSKAHLQCRIALAANQLETALQTASNLLSLAAGQGQPRRAAESHIVLGTVLARMGQVQAAMAAFEKAQAPTMPAPERREAFLRSLELSLGRDDLAEAARRLEQFIAAHPGDALADEVLLALGQIRLKEHLLGTPLTNLVAGAEGGVAAGMTNRLRLALQFFDQVAQKGAPGSLTGRAHLYRGWALLLDGKPAESQSAFQLALEKLPLSEDQAVARFKLADIAFQQKDFTNALAGYRKVIEDYGGLPRIRTGLFDRAWYQIARLCLQAGDYAGASDAVSKILMLYPTGRYAEPILLLTGQELAESNRLAEARALFNEFSARFTNSTLLPQVILAMARSHELEGQWTRALETYEAFLGRFATNELTPRAHFQRAMAAARAGQTTNAYAWLTNFLARHPVHEYAPRAQNWIGDYYFRAGNFAEAERAYQRLFQNTNWAGHPLAFEAMFKAGKSAVMRRGYDDATNYFVELLKDQRCPPALAAQTFFAYGDALTARPVTPESTNALGRFETAIEIFRKVPQLYPGSPLVPRAQGRIADCHFQIASLVPQRYTNALEAYELAARPPADLETRSQAEVGVGNTLLRMAALQTPADTNLMQQALDRFLNVLYGKNLREGEKPSPLWSKEAGLAAARVLEMQKRPAEAIRVYERLQQMLPSLRPTLERRIAAARQQLPTQSN